MFLKIAVIATALMASNICTAQTSIDHTVLDIRGNRVALVVAFTGSMAKSGVGVAQEYLAALYRYKDIVGVYLFERFTQKHEAGNVYQLEAVMKPRGNVGNALNALLMAKADRPDAIIFVTNQQGDDWGDWSRVKDLPPIIAHCVPSRNSETIYRKHVGCDKALRKLVDTVPGSRYIETLPSK